MRLIFLFLLVTSSFAVSQTTKLDHPYWGEAIQLLPEGGNIAKGNLHFDTTDNIYVPSYRDYKYDVKKKTWSRFDSADRYRYMHFFEDGLIIYKKDDDEFYYTYNLGQEEDILKLNIRKTNNFFKDDKGCLVFFAVGGIVKSTNMGAYWNRDEPDIDFLRHESMAYVTYFSVFKNYYYVSIRHKVSKPKGEIYKNYYSPDRGKNWIEYSIGDSTSIVPVSFIDQETLIVPKYINNKKTFFLTTDIGDTWTKINAPVEGTYYDKLHCNNLDVMYFRKANSDSLYRSTDIGKTWEIVLDQYGYFSFDFHDNIYVQYFDTVFKSTNYGDDWEKIHLRYQSFIAKDFDMDKFGRLYVAYENGLLRQNGQGCDTLIENNIGVWYIDFTKKNDYMIVRDSTFLFSDDYGESWQRINQTTDGYQFAYAGSYLKFMDDGSIYSEAWTKKGKFVIIISRDEGRTWQYTGIDGPCEDFAINSYGEYLRLVTNSGLNIYDEKEGWVFIKRIEQYYSGYSYLWCHSTKPLIFAHSLKSIARSTNNGHDLTDISETKEVFVDGSIVDRSQDYYFPRVFNYKDDLYQITAHSGSSFSEDLDYIFNSSDFGLTWHNVSEGITRRFRANWPKILNDGHLYGVNGEFGVLKSKEPLIVTSIKDEKNNDFEITIYPNPSESGIFNIQLDESFLNKLVEISIINMLGQVVNLSKFTNNRNDIELNLSNLSRGHYTAIISSGKSVSIEKLIIL
jgi:type IX secretion system substrate protein